MSKGKKSGPDGGESLSFIPENVVDTLSNHSVQSLFSRQEPLHQRKPSILLALSPELLILSPRNPKALENLPRDLVIPDFPMDSVEKLSTLQFM